MRVGIELVLLAAFLKKHIATEYQPPEAVCAMELQLCASASFPQDN